MKHDTFNIGKKEHYLQGVQSSFEVGEFYSKKIIHPPSLVGVMGAYFFYMEMAVVRFHYEVQIVLLAQLVRAAHS